jgi:hypothetical protein
MGQEAVSRFHVFHWLRAAADDRALVAAGEQGSRHDGRQGNRYGPLRDAASGFGHLSSLSSPILLFQAGPELSRAGRSWIDEPCRSHLLSRCLGAARSPRDGTTLPQPRPGPYQGPVDFSRLSSHGRGSWSLAALRLP